MAKKAAVIMGSDSDWPIVQKAVSKLKSFGVETEVHVMSAQDAGGSLRICQKRGGTGLWRNHCGGRHGGASGRRAGGTYHFAGNRNPHEVGGAGRNGRASRDGNDASRRTSSDSRNRRGGQRRHTGSADSGAGRSGIGTEAS